MKKTIYILLVSVTTLFVSCGDFLEPKSQSEYSPKDISSLNELILGEAIPAAYHKDRFITGILSLLDDDITCNPYMNPGSGTNFYEDTKFLGVKAVYTWQPQYSRDLLERGFNRYDMYSSYYEYIMGCNAALDYLDKVS